MPQSECHDYIKQNSERCGMAHGMSIINERDITVKKQSVNADVFEKLDKAVESATVGLHLGGKGYGHNQLKFLNFLHKHMKLGK